jgi:hypothetical protein
VIFIPTPQNYGRLLLGKANGLLLHVIADALPKSASMTHFNFFTAPPKTLRAPNQTPSRSARRSRRG